MKKVVRKIDEYTTLLRDTRTGVAVVRSMRLGCEFSIHPNIDKTGSGARHEEERLLGQARPRCALLRCYLRHRQGFP